MLMVYLGVALRFRSTLAIIALPFVLWLMHWGVITREEKYLEAGFGEAYTSYKSRVRRWI
jgi:protein-S-isoprenylcysteine O-methyltransferase Ste14